MNCSKFLKKYIEMIPKVPYYSRTKKAILICIIAILIVISSILTIFAITFNQHKIYITNKGITIDGNCTPIKKDSGTTDLYYYTDREKKTSKEPEDVYLNKQFDSIEQAEECAGFDIVLPIIHGFSPETIYVDKRTGTASISMSYKNNDKNIEIEYNCYKNAKSWSRTEEYSNKLKTSYSYQNKYGYLFTIQEIDANVEICYAYIAFPDYYIQICCEGIDKAKLNNILDTMNFSIYEGEKND